MVVQYAAPIGFPWLVDDSPCVEVGEQAVIDECVARARRHSLKLNDLIVDVLVSGGNDTTQALYILSSLRIQRCAD